MVHTWLVITSVILVVIMLCRVVYVWLVDGTFSTLRTGFVKASDMLLLWPLTLSHRHRHRHKKEKKKDREREKERERDRDRRSEKERSSRDDRERSTSKKKRSKDKDRDRDRKSDSEKGDVKVRKQSNGFSRLTSEQ